MKKEKNINNETHSHKEESSFSGAKEKVTKTELGLDQNLEGLLCYVLGWVSGIVMFIVEKDNHFIKFHALQSIVAFLGLTIISFVIGMIPFLGWIINMFISIIAIALWIVLMLKAYKGERYKLPIVGDITESLLKKETPSL
ncbi:MAG TPA: DUF4870 domain-containing protein [Candidatus Paceibacterota bacterium]|nr:DUF4870 domain-containing protein [Candidatus Paceibacterota bacterium]